ncbi:MAG: hypothetical protein L0Z55_07200 [Planctomycetes bacterium]|nr:hypothetical protein [Planctomycetota bacterium]
MRMNTAVRWLAIVLIAQHAGYMTYDGTRALVAGDYLRPTSGEYAGQLGPWTHLAEAIGIDPMSTLMKSIFLVLGLAGLAAGSYFIARPRAGFKAVLVFSVATLWNLMFGTMSSVLQIVLLLLWNRLDRAKQG